MRGDELFDHESLRYRPETYKTILGSLYGRNTETLKLRIRINKLLRDGAVCQTFLRGSRFGEKIFYHPAREYQICMVSDGRVVNCYYCLGYEVVGRDLLLKDSFMLSGASWVVVSDASFFVGHVLCLF